MDERLMQALRICPDCVQDGVMRLSQRASLCVEEIRFRAEKPITIYAAGREWNLEDRGAPMLASTQMISQVVACAAEYSVYHSQEQLCRGFCTVSGGHRVGICGEAVCERGRIVTVKDFSSVNLRVAHEVRGTADFVTDLIWQAPASVLIFGMPGAGKTTVLRDTVRQLSDRLHYSVSLVDERMEIAAAVNGIPQFDIGCGTDVLSGAPKSEAIPLLLRTMRPEWIALDEITEQEDVNLIAKSANCGVNIVATAHARTAEDLLRRPVYRRLLQQNIFVHYVRLDKNRNLHTERITL